MIYSALKYYSGKDPKKIAVIHDNKVFSYSDLWSDINLISYWICKNLDASNKVAIMLDNSYGSIISIYGTVLGEGIIIPLDSDMGQKNIKYILTDASVSLIVTEKKYKKKIEQIISTTQKVELRIIEDFYNNQELIKSNKSRTKYLQLNNHTEAVKKPESVAAIFYTTGTTGLNKGVQLTHSNLMAATKNINTIMEIGSWAVESLPMRLSHSFGFARLRCVFEVGGKVILENGFIRPERIIYNMIQYNANAISSVPAGFTLILEFFKDYFREVSSKIKYIEIGSSYMRGIHKKTLIELCPNAKIFYHYGSTEASRSSFIEFRSEENKLRSVGKPSPNVKIRIINKSGLELPPNQNGQIVVKGKMVTKGYLNKDDLNKINLKNGWFYSGDTGYMDNDGYLYYIGRKDDVINLGGLKVSPEEIEEVLIKF